MSEATALPTESQPLPQYQHCYNNKIYCRWAVVVAQLAVWSLPILEIRSLNPVIGKTYSELSTVEKMKIKKKEAGNGPFFN